MQFSPQKHMDAMIVDKNCLVNTLMQPINVAIQFLMCTIVSDILLFSCSGLLYIQYNIVLIYYFY